jgi:hypothetical protein
LALALAAAGCTAAAVCCSWAQPCAAQSAKLADAQSSRDPAADQGSRPDYGVDAEIESDLLRGPRARTAARSAGSPKDTARKTLRVLLVGNSYTRFNLLHMLIERIGESAGGPRLHIDVEARSGFSLRMHLKSHIALTKIRNGHYSHVVLQGHSLSAIDHPDELAEDAERFHDEIAASGSHTVLYETWARKPNNSLYRKHAQVHSFEDMVGRVDTTYSSIARHLGAGLAPVGGAFERAWRGDHDLALWGADGSHPTLAGSYMAACVLYGAITGRDPQEADWAPFPLDAKLAHNIRAVASATLRGVPDWPAERETAGPALAANGGPRPAAVTKPGRAPAVSAKVTRVGNKPTANTGHVAASIAAMIGRAPGQTEAPDMLPDAEAAESTGGGTAAGLPVRKPTQPAFLDAPLGSHAASDSSVHTF